MYCATVTLHHCHLRLKLLCKKPICSEHAWHALLKILSTESFFRDRFKWRHSWDVPKLWFWSAIFFVSLFQIGVGTCGTSGNQMTSFAHASQYMYKKWRTCFLYLFYKILQHFALWINFQMVNQLWGCQMESKNMMVISNLFTKQ